eukprot:GHVL01009682.1.p1 GENE.GHVL01009682.1~~GHVL01009682.1.p1  ORF type:complete len:277 (+),score=70.44 GHVL01009682.1:1386-2216(+)
MEQMMKVNENEALLWIEREIEDLNIETPHWEDTKIIFKKDDRYRALGSASERENVFKTIVNQICKKDRSKRERGGEDAESDDLSKKRKKMQLEEACIQLKNLISEKLKNPFNVSEDDRERILSSDGRYQNALLTDNDKQRVYDEVCRDALRDRLRQFSILLTNNSSISSHLAFEDLEDILHLSSDRRFKSVPQSSLAQEYYDWKRSQADDAKAAFRKLLLTSSDVRVDGEEDDVVEKIVTQLSDDVRYKRLECIGGERRKMIVQRVRELRAAKSKH